MLGLSLLLVATLSPSAPWARADTIEAAWVVEENARPGTRDWRIPSSAPTDIEGYADRVSAGVGERVRLFVDTTASSFHVEAYRLGWYGGDGGRRIWTSSVVPGVQQRPPRMNAKTRMVEARWIESLAFHVGEDWVQGTYLLKLVSSTGGQAYVPLVLRDVTSTARILVTLPVNTWQAYNDWGGASLYVGPSGSSSDRATVVSFDRPYHQTRGAGRMLSALPLIALIESQGLDITYWTDMDLHSRPALVRQHQSLLVLQHDEYWSTAMRSGVTKARAAGVNLAFLGGNAVYWHIRVEDSPLGDDRRIVCYKSKEADPLTGVDDDEVTVRWAEPPVSRPQSTLLGAMYGCSGVVDEDFVVADPDAWVFEGTGLRQGDVIPGVVNYEVDWIVQRKPTPGNIQILGHSPVRCGDGKSRFADMTYYTASSGAGVFYAANIGWLDGVRCGPPSPGELCDPRVQTITLNIIRAFATRPAGIDHPAQPNAADFGYTLKHPTSP